MYTLLKKTMLKLKRTANTLFYSSCDRILRGKWRCHDDHRSVYRMDTSNDVATGSSDQISHTMCKNLQRRKHTMWKFGVRVLRLPVYAPTKTFYVRSCDVMC
jgi:hypothetical protein